MDKIVSTMFCRVIKEDLYHRELFNGFKLQMHQSFKWGLPCAISHHRVAFTHTCIVRLKEKDVGQDSRSRNDFTWHTTNTWYKVSVTPASVTMWNWFQLESLSKDDLVKFVKKQMLLLQRERTKTEGTACFSLFSNTLLLIHLKNHVSVYLYKDCMSICPSMGLAGWLYKTIPCWLFLSILV